MGPILILDKSALQSLSLREMRRLRKHFSLNVPPILIAEILGDLAKTDAAQREQVIHLAKKMPAIDNYENEHYLRLCLAEFAGGKFEMRGVPILGGGTPVVTKSGERGMFFDATPEQLALLRWSQGDFSDSDKLLAATWRGMIPKIDIESYKHKLNRYYIVIPHADNFQDLAAAADRLLGERSLRESLLNCLLDEFEISGTIRNLILFTWSVVGRPDLRAYAPYASYCLRVMLVFIGGIRSKLISLDSTNRLDLEYCYYLPFCMGFVSRDHLHRELSAALLGPEQDFIEGDRLKSELRELADEWDALSGVQRNEREAEYGDYPPEREGSIASMMWKKNMNPWSPGSGNRAIQMSKEQEARLMAKLDEYSEAIENAKRQQG
jgi:hypothetical protein